ncbi:MAG TPA: carboxypeptidase regulatory-like domain-containing protein, partial [Haliangium sp.]|nr:carboxypeptidase regulatory-like domain-containing protein [Haliangium sp.]
VRLARVHGRVVDGNGDPVAEALVRHRTSLLDRAIDSRHTAPTGEAWSGADGAFAVLVPPGRVTLLASAPGRTPSSTRIHWVAPGAELRGVEIVMDQGADVSGRVVDTAGKAVSGARVVGRVEAPEAGDEAPAGELGATSGPDGAFALRAVPPGRLVLQAEAEGHAPSPAVAVTVSGEPGGRRENVVLRLTAPAPLAGRVVDEQGAGIAGATVRALRPMSQITLPSATTDAQGRFEVMLAPGPVDVTATAPGFAPGRASGIAASSQAVVVTLARGGAIAGVVTGGGQPDVQPLRHFTVHVVQRAAPSGAPGARIDFWEQGMRVVSPDGSYRVADLAPGRYSVTAAAPGLAPVEQPDVVVAPGRETRVDLALAPGAALAGTVRDARSQAPVAGAVVRLSTGSELAMTYTDAAGGFAISDIAPGRRSLEVQHPGYVGRVESGLELAQGAQQRVDVALTPAGADGDRALEIAGIGAVLSMQEQRLMVQDLVPHGPAAVAGIERGEEVFSIDGRGTQGQSFGDNIEGIRGLAGTVVRLGLRLGERERFLDVVRGNVRVTQQPQASEE